MQQKGGTGQDIGTLGKGIFYVYSTEAETTQPIKVQVPMCLSWHPNDPLSEDEVLRRAVESCNRR